MTKHTKKASTEQGSADKNELKGSSEKLLKQARRVHRMYLREAFGTTEEMASLLTPKYPPMTLEFQRSHPDWWDVYPKWPNSTDPTSSANGDTTSRTPTVQRSTDSEHDTTDGTTSTESTSDSATTRSGRSKPTTDTLRVAPFTESLPKPTDKPSVEGFDPNVWIGPVDESHRLLPEAWERIGTLDPDRPFVAFDPASDGATAVGYQNRKDGKVYVIGSDDDYASAPRWLTIDKLMADVLKHEALTTTRRIMLNDYAKTPEDEIQVEHAKLTAAHYKACREIDDAKGNRDFLEANRETVDDYQEREHQLARSLLMAYEAEEEVRGRLEGFKLIHNLPPYEKRNKPVEKTGQAGNVYETVEAQLLGEAIATINGDRQDMYGSAENSFPVMAELWSAWLTARVRDIVTYEHEVNDDGMDEISQMKVTLQDTDVAMAMALYKIGREAQSPKRDNRVDAAGYVGLYERCLSQRV